MSSIFRKSFSVFSAALIIFSLYVIVVSIRPPNVTASTPESYFTSPPGSDWGVLYTNYATEDATAFSAAAASAADIASSWGIVGLLGLASAYARWKCKKRKY